VTVLAPAVEAFVDEAFARFDGAAGSEPPIGVCVAGRALRFRFAAPGLRERFVPALRHLASTTATPSLTVCCWDASTTAAVLPDPPWPRGDFLPRSRIRGHIAGPVVATYDADGQLFQLYDRRCARALLHAGAGNRLPDWHDRAPFKALLALWAQDEGLALLHGAALAQDGRGVVLAGRSGAGKSTTALTCRLAGMDMLADDACLVDIEHRTVSSVYGRAKLEPDAADRLRGRGLPLTTSPRDAPLVLSPPVGRHAELCGIALLRVGTSSACELSCVLSARDALEALVETARPESDGLTPGALGVLERVVETFAVRCLVLGSDPDHIVATIRGLCA